MIGDKMANPMTSERKMRKVLLILPGWLDVARESVLRVVHPGVSVMAELGELSHLAQIPAAKVPEGLLLGMGPDEVNLEQGPLTVAALGVDPPEKSIHFHLTPMSLADGFLHEHKLELPPEQVDMIMAKAKSLNTRSLTVVPGEGVDHGLVWEGHGELGAHSPSEADGKPYRACLPVGDNEPALRRFIDDSCNILADLELNQIRQDQGLPPINVLWPWGQGMRTRLPNLALMRGEPVIVISPSLRLAGLTRLCGYYHCDRAQIKRPLSALWQGIARKALDGQTTLIYSPAFEEFRERGLIEEAAWLTRQLDDLLIGPILNSARDIPTRFSIFAPCRKGTGLSAVYETKMNEGNLIPFDERALEEQLPQLQLHEAVDLALA